MKTVVTGLIISLLFPPFAFAQVDDIKSESSSRSEEKSSRSSSTSSSYSDNTISGEGIVAVFQFIGEVASWQEHRIEKESIHAISLELFLQGAFQPSSYYILHPRIRLNVGLFSTDFRFNYLIEEDIEGAKHIRTDDWQILQLNVVHTKNFLGRVGGGILHEDYSGGKTFPEWTAGLNVQSNNQKIGGMAEFRWSEPRSEVSAQLQYKIFSVKSLNAYATAGVVFQRYYNKIDVWGMQGGLMIRIY